MGFHPQRSGLRLVHAKDGGRTHCVATSDRSEENNGAARLCMGGEGILLTSDYRGTKRKHPLFGPQNDGRVRDRQNGSELHSNYKGVEGFGDLDARADLFAGASTLAFCRAMEYVASPVELPDMQSDHNVVVREECLQCLAGAGRRYRCKVTQSPPTPKSRTRSSVATCMRCEICPFRALDKVHDLLDNVDRDHSRTRFSALAGRRMLNAVYALFDEDHINRTPCSAYIAPHC